MSTTYEIIALVLVVIAIAGQFVFVLWRRNKTFFDPKHAARARAELIEREFDRQTGKK